MAHGQFKCLQAALKTSFREQTIAIFNTAPIAMHLTDAELRRLRTAVHVRLRDSLD